MRSLPRGFDIALITLLAGAALFYGLGDLPIDLWDESRLANNAIEMLSGQSWLVTTYDGEPDLWNTKPPLQIWLMASSMKLLGPSEYALRLPSALAAYGSVIAVYWFTVRQAENRFVGLIASAVLLATIGYVQRHVARTADYDSLLVLFTTLATFSWFILVEQVRHIGRPPAKWLAIFVLATAMGILVKGIAGLLLLPGFAIYALFRGAVPTLLISRASWLGLAVLFAIPSAFYLAREWAEPGYLAAVQANEVGGRFLGAIEGHNHEFGYHFANLVRLWRPSSGYITYSAAPWSLLAPAALVAGLASSRYRVCTAYLAVVIICFLIIISMAQTKLPWYPAPIYPLLAVLVALGGYSAIQRVSALVPGPSGATVLAILLAGAMIASVAVMAAVVYRNLLNIENVPQDLDMQFGQFLRTIDPAPGDEVRILHDDTHNTPPEADAYSPQEKFYAKRFELAGVDTKVVSGDYVPERGQWVIWCDDHVFNVPTVAGKTIAQNGSCHVVEAEGGGRP